MPAASYIPAKDADFDAFFNNFQTLIAANPTDYGLVAGDATAITASYNTWHASYLLATNPDTRTTPVIAQKDANRTASVALIRPYAQQISRNDAVSPELVTGLGLNLPNPTRPPIPPPLTFPVLGLISLAPRTINLRYTDSALGASKQKPVGAIGMELVAVVGVAPAVSPENGRALGTFTKAPLVASFDAADQGKTATFFGRWVTKSGAGGKAYVGPWSAPLSQVIA